MMNGSTAGPQVWRAQGFGEFYFNEIDDGDYIPSRNVITDRRDDYKSPDQTEQRFEAVKMRGDNL